MNMKTLTIILMLASSVSAMAQGRNMGPPGDEVITTDNTQVAVPNNPGARSSTTTTTTTDAAAVKESNTKNQAVIDQAIQMTNSNQFNEGQKCDALASAEKSYKSMVPAQEVPPNVKDGLYRCDIFRVISGGPITAGSKDDTKTSADGKISCKKFGSYTADYDPCERALNFYSGVVVAESAMNLEQKVRTDLKNQNIAKKSQEAMASGASQTAMFDAATESNNHQKSMQQEKAIAYAAAVAALVNAYRMIPSIDKIMENTCPRVKGEAQAKCQPIMKNDRPVIAANGAAKNALMGAIMEFTAKGVAAGIAMGQFGNAAKQTEAAKNSLTDDSTDLMMERCVLNPTDPACAKNRSRTSLDPIASGDFGFSGGEGNSFNMAPDSTVAPEMGNETNLEENAPVAGVNTPFANDAKIAKGILDPAAGAQMQATGGAQGGGGGGGSGGGGGGGASLGSDLNGANKDGDKEAQIKTNKVAGAYAQGSGGGYKGVGRSKDDANPFASLFDAKGSGGGVEEDRSIASGDIDGAASGLFQKISKRYGQVQADKRLETKNLE